MYNRCPSPATKILFALVYFCLAVVNVDGQQGACYRPFVEFLGCVKPEAQNRLDLFMGESSSRVRTTIQGCFSESDCTTPNFQRATLSTLLPKPWSHRTQLLVDLIEKSSRDVQLCMVDYFVEQARVQIQSCVNKHGSGTAAEFFRLPSLPKLGRLNVQSLKQSVLDRILVSESAIDCARRSPKDGRLIKTLKCINAARGRSSASSTTMCHKRDECKSNIDARCTPAFDAVQNAACSCFKAEKEKFLKGNLQDFRRIIDVFVRGGLTNQYKTCCTKFNVPIPYTKLDEIHESIRASTRDTMLSGLPVKVQRVSAQMITQISEEVEKILCGACSSDDEASLKREAGQLRIFSNGGLQDGGDNVLSKGLSGLFKNLING
uniref:Uncharacterized protein n=1 Tax=Romanomermis culicivorax TaxID=13658 RepID=A0A915KQ77_ROMCU